MLILLEQIPWLGSILPFMATFLGSASAWAVGDFLHSPHQKQQEEQNNISKACIRSDFWQQNLVPLETNSVAQHPTLNYLKTNLIGRFWSMCDFSRKQDKSVVNSWEHLYKSIVTLRDLASLSLVCLTWTLFLPFSHKIGKERDCSQYAVPQNYINYI